MADIVRSDLTFDAIRSHGESKKQRSRHVLITNIHTALMTAPRNTTRFMSRDCHQSTGAEKS